MTVAELAIVYEMQLALEALQAEALSAMTRGDEAPVARHLRFAGLKEAVASATDVLEQLDELGLKA